MEWVLKKFQLMEQSDISINGAERRFNYGAERHFNYWSRESFLKSDTEYYFNYGAERHFN